jgi:hypothetical protein
VAQIKTITINQPASWKTRAMDLAFVIQYPFPMGRAGLRC